MVNISESYVKIIIILLLSFYVFLIIDAFEVMLLLNQENVLLNLN